jgi:hypothetical protein
MMIPNPIMSIRTVMKMKVRALRLEPGSRPGT